MKLHAYAALSLNQRRRLARRVVDGGWSLVEAAGAAETSERIAGKWVARYRVEGDCGLLDRSSAPRSVPSRTSEDRVQVIVACGGCASPGPRSPRRLEMASSTVSAILRRVGLGKLSRLEAPEPIRRYQKRRAGELLHIDVKKLGRISAKGAGHRVTGETNRQSQHHRREGHSKRGLTGWEYVHVCVDDATRLAYAEVLPNERAVTATAFLRRCLAFYRAHGVHVERVMSDNGAAYVSAVFALACRALKIKHCRTRPYRPQTNGKNRALHPHAALRMGLRARLRLLPERTAALTGWLERYNTSRRHSALGHQPPLARLNELQANNVPSTYT